MEKAIPIPILILTSFLRGVQEVANAALWRVCEHSRHLFPVKAGQKL